MSDGLELFFPFWLVRGDFPMCARWQAIVRLSLRGGVEGRLRASWRQAAPSGCVGARSDSGCWSKGIVVDKDTAKAVASCTLSRVPEKTLGP